jgi:hypothetical protein
VNLLEKIKYKLPGTGSYYNQKALIWRNRGASTALEIIDAVRIKYGDRPDIHELSTGERIPAVPKDYVGNLFGGGSYFMAVEGNDDQLVVFKPKFDLEELKTAVENDDTDAEDFLVSGPIDFETDMSSEEIKERLIDKDYSVVNFGILDNRDERFTFLSEELKTADEKYSVGSMLWENMDIVLTVVTAIAVTIIIYSVTSDLGPAIDNFGQQVQNLDQNLAQTRELLNQTAPPGR